MRNLLTVAAMALVVPLFAACSGGTSTSAESVTASSAPASTAEASSAAPADPAPADGITIGFPIPGPAPYIDAYFENWDKLAAAEGATVIKTMGDWTPALQAEQIDSLIAQKPDVIVIWAADNKAIIPVLARIKEAGIKAFATNAYPEEAAFEYLAGYTGPDDVLQGRLAGEDLIAAIGGSGEVGMIRGTPGTAAHDARAQGFEEALSAAPDVKLVADQSGAWGDSKKTYDIASAMLKQNPGVVGIYVQDDGTAEGAAQAAKDANADIKIVGINGTCSAFDLIRTGILSGTTFQDPWADAEEAFNAAVALFRGETIEKTTFLDPPVVSLENIDTFDCRY